MNTYIIVNQNVGLTNNNRFPNSINNINKTLTISPVQKYNMAVKNLYEGLTISKNISNENNFPFYSNTLNNIPINIARESTKKSQHIINNQNSQRNKKTTSINNRVKNLKIDINKDTNNAFLTNNNYSTIDTQNRRGNKINKNLILNTKMNALTSRILTNYEDHPHNSMNNNNAFKINNFLKKQNNEYKKKINEMSNKINELTNESQMLKIENKKLINDNMNLLEKMKLFENLKKDDLENKKLELLKVNELTITINNLKFQIKKYKEQIMNINNENKIKQNENNKKIFELTKKFNSLKEENDVLKNKIKNLENTININKKIIENNNNNEKAPSSQISDTFIINKQYNDIKINNINKINNHTNINSINDGEINSMKNEVDEQNKKINSLKEKINELTANLNKEKNLNKDLNNEIKKLNNLVTDLKKEIINNQETIMDLSNANNILKIRVNSVHSGNFKLNAFRSEEKNQELEKQIQELQQINEDLQEKVNLLSKGSDTNDNILKLINEKQKIIEENKNLQKKNLDLQNELLITKAQINEINENEENENDIISENDKYLINIKSDIVKNLEKELEELKNQYNEDLELLNKKEAEYNNKINKESNNESSYLIEINELKKDIEDKKTKIDKLENELILENFKKINNIVNDKNKDYLEQMKIFNNETSQMPKNDKIYLMLNGLNKELEDKNNLIEKLMEENNTLKNIKNNNNANIKSKENELRSASSNEINETEKIKLLKNEIKDLKEMNQSDIKQIKTLKDEIKELNEKIKKMETFNGQFKNYDEFMTLLDNALLNYKPKKKEQKASLNRLLEIIKNHHA